MLPATKRNQWIDFTWEEILQQVFIDEPPMSSEERELDELMKVKIKGVLDSLKLPESKV